jgi:alpha-galactosidase
MPYFLESPHFHFALNPNLASWSLYGSHQESPFLENIHMRVGYRRGRRRYLSFAHWFEPQIHAPQEVDSTHGIMHQLTVELSAEPNGLHCTLEFALLQDHPLFIWRMTLENRGKHPLEIDRLELLRAGSFDGRANQVRRSLLGPGYITTDDPPPAAPASIIRPHPNPGELAFFSNGWQTWSYTGTYGAKDVYRATRLGLIEAQRWYASGRTPQRKQGLFISDMFGVLGDRKHRTGILAGFLAQKQHFGSLEAYIADPLDPALSLWASGDRARLSPGAQITTDWAVIQFVDIDARDPLGPYLEAVAREHVLRSSVTRHPSSVGWCSWYHFYQDISEEKIRANLQAAVKMRDSLPLELIQIDDGFQTHAGDWFDFSPGFPEGVDRLADEIKAAGLTPGLWLAPFIVDPRSKLAREHRDYLLRNRLGFPVHAGFQWNHFAKTLDLTRPGTLDYVKEVVRTAAHEWGYPYLKLDFLYAAAIRGYHFDRTKTRAQVLRSGLETLRAAVGPEVTLLGCGCPLGSGIGIFDAMRIGADVDPRWNPSFAGIEGPFKNEPNMPSTRNALQNILTRAPFHNRWWMNDPDCLLIRPDSHLTLAEVRSLATAIALTGGSLLLSDDLPNIPPERLRIAEQLFPIIGPSTSSGQAIRVPDWFDAPTPCLLRLDLENKTGLWHLLSIFNWDDTPQDVTLPLERFDLSSSDYFAREFWSGVTQRISGGLLTLERIPAHGVKVLALTPNPSPTGRGESLYLGSDLHISQGLEVSGWSVSATNLRILLERPGKAEGVIDLYLSESPIEVILNQKEISWQSLENDVYRIPVKFKQTAEIEIL